MERKIRYSSASKDFHYPDTHCLRGLKYPVEVIAKSLLTGEEVEMTLYSQEDCENMITDEWDLFVK